MKKLLVICMVLYASSFFSGTAFAGSVEKLGNYMMRPFINNGAWQRSFDTNNGLLTVKYHYVPDNNPQGQGHIILQMNGEEIYSAYCPGTTENFHRMSIFKDRSTGKLFFALYLEGRILLWGYDNSLKPAGYLDTNKMPSNGESAPVIRVDEDGDLELFYTSTNSEYGKRYKLFWDASKQGVGYKDVTRVYIPPVVVQESGWATSTTTTSTTPVSTWEFVGEWE